MEEFRPDHIITNSRRLADLLCYPQTLELEWLAAEKIVETVKNRHGPYRKIEDWLRKKVKEFPYRNHITYERVRSWWGEVHQIPQRNFYIFSATPSLPVTFDPLKYDDYAPKLYSDSLDLVASARDKLCDALGEAGYSRGYLVFLDELFFPFPIEIDTKELPKNLNPYFVPHVVNNSLIWCSADYIKVVESTIANKDRESIPLSKKENMFLADEECFRKELRYSKSTVKALMELQMNKFVSDLEIEESDVYLLGSPTELNPYLSYLPKGELVNPYAGAGFEQRQKVMREGGITSDRSIKHLINRLEKTHAK